MYKANACRYTLFEFAFQICSENESFCDVISLGDGSRENVGRNYDFSVVDRLLGISNRTVIAKTNEVFIFLLKKSPARFLYTLFQMKHRCVIRSEYWQGMWDNMRKPDCIDRGKAYNSERNDYVFALVVYISNVSWRFSKQDEEVGESVLRQILTHEMTNTDQNHDELSVRLMNVLGSSYALDLLATGYIPSCVSAMTHCHVVDRVHSILMGLELVFQDTRCRTPATRTIDRDIIHYLCDSNTLRSLQYATRRAQKQVIYTISQEIRHAGIDCHSVQYTSVLKMYVKLSRCILSQCRLSFKKNSKHTRRQWHQISKCLSEGFLQCHCPKITAGGVIQLNLTYFAQNVLVKTHMSVLYLFTKVLDQVSYKCDGTILHVCGIMRVLIEMQICYSDVVHRAKQIETERVLQRCVKIVQEFIHLYCQNLRDNGRKLRKLIFSIPNFRFCTLPSKRIIKTILRHVVEKQTLDSDITEILETLSAFATVLERWTVSDKICVQCVAQIIQYISVVFSQNSTLATPHRAVFFQILYICLRLMRVVDSTKKSFTSRSLRQNEQIVGNLVPSLYDLLQNLPDFESRETRLYVKFLQLYYHLLPESFSPRIHCDSQALATFNLRASVVSSLSSKKITHAKNRLMQKSLIIIGEIALQKEFEDTFLSSIVSLSIHDRYAQSLILGIMWAQIRLLRERHNAATFDTILEQFLLINCYTMTDILLRHDLDLDTPLILDEIKSHIIDLTHWTCIAENIIQLLHLHSNSEEVNFYVGEIVLQCMSFFCHTNLAFINSSSSLVDTHSMNQIHILFVSVLKVVSMWQTLTGTTSSTVVHIAACFSLLRRLSQSHIIRKSYLAQEQYLFILNTLTGKYERLHPSVNTSIVCAVLSQSWFLSDTSQPSFPQNSCILTQTIQNTRLRAYV